MSILKEFNSRCDDLIENEYPTVEDILSLVYFYCDNYDYLNIKHDLYCGDTIEECVTYLSLNEWEKLRVLYKDSWKLIKKATEYLDFDSLVYRVFEDVHSRMLNHIEEKDYIRFIYEFSKHSKLSTNIFSIKFDEIGKGDVDKNIYEQRIESLEKKLEKSYNEIKKLKKVKTTQELIDIEDLQKSNKHLSDDNRKLYTGIRDVNKTIKETIHSMYNDVSY